MIASDNMSVISNSEDNLREKFVQDLNGSTMGEVLLYSSQFPLLAFVAICIELFILNKFNKSSLKSAPQNIGNSLLIYLLEILMIVLPVTLMFTILSDYIYVLFLSVIGLITVIIISSVSCVDDQILYWKFTSLNQVLLYNSIDSKKQLFITYFRSFVLLVTAVSILGVDFHIFPRRFAKTETYGVSLMDLGVGFFVISNALVEKSCSSIAGLKKTMLSSIFLIFLGMTRVLLVQRLGYQMHITEYGRDWNFFFTLAFVKILSSLLLIIFRGHSFVSGLVVITIHQYLLSHSLEALVLSTNGREDWFSANQEGIISLSGYLSIHLFGITIANFVNPVDKSLLIKNKLKSVVIFTVLSNFLLSILFYYDSLIVSRRLANLYFVLWVVAVSLELLVLFLVVEFLSCWLLPIEPKLRNNMYNLLIPVLLESINFNGLIFFLLSNFITGLINIYIDAFNTDSLMSSIILVSYMFVDCTIVFILYACNIRLSF